MRRQCTTGVYISLLQHLRKCWLGMIFETDGTAFILCFTFIFAKPAGGGMSCVGACGAGLHTGGRRRCAPGPPVLYGADVRPHPQHSFGGDGRGKSIIRPFSCFLDCVLVRFPFSRPCVDVTLCPHPPPCFSLIRFILSLPGKGPPRNFTVTPPPPPRSIGKAHPTGMTLIATPDGSRGAP